ncbi:MAG: tetraacyldisaccharide 4'-kinase [Deltaproteobacteria bacterium]|jgi:tetraacyldisaccharide 4'-kinase|nr:tetraacyldisaccharide 4'-kinase [Deltaproteobacteria bacterium]
MTKPSARPLPLLAPLGAVWGSLTAARRRAYERGWLPSYDLGVPTFSVGNLTLGGNGKTPMALWLAGQIGGLGRGPAILSRGYGRTPDKRKREPLVVSAGDGPLVGAREAGDEPYCLAMRSGCPVVVARDRVLAGVRALELGADALVLDDGFQHLALKRHLDVLMIRTPDDPSRQKVVPAGYLRENPRAQSKADVLVALGREAPPWLVRMAAGRPLFLARLKPSCLLVPPDFGRVPLASLPPGPLAAFCGLGRPGAFWDTLDGLGLDVAARLALPDHAAYGPASLRRLAEFRRASRAKSLLTTLKDAVKLPPDFSRDVLALDVGLELDRPGEFLKIAAGVLAAGRKERP